MRTVWNASHTQPSNVPSNRTTKLWRMVISYKQGFCLALAVIKILKLLSNHPIFFGRSPPKCSWWGKELPKTHENCRNCFANIGKFGEVNKSLQQPCHSNNPVLATTALYKLCQTMAVTTLDCIEWCGDPERNQPKHLDYLYWSNCFKRGAEKNLQVHISGLWKIWTLLLWMIAHGSAFLLTKM